MNVVKFFNKNVVIKKVPTSGKVRRWSSTATVDCNIQEDREEAEIMGADFGTVYRGYFELSDPVRAGFKITEQISGIEYTIDAVEQVDHPITGTSYLEATLIRDKSKQNRGTNR